MTEYFVKTETGSVYLLNRSRMSWRRASSSKYPIRTDNGSLLEWPSIEVGKPLILIGPPLTEGADVRVISTSLITEIKEVEIG